MMNCFGGYKLSRYVDAKTTERTEDIPLATPTVDSGDTGIVTIPDSVPPTADSGDTGMSTTPESIPPTSSPSAEGSDKKDDVSQDAIIGLAVSIPGTIATIVGVWVTIFLHRKPKKKVRTGTLGFDDTQLATSLISLGRQR
jgi:hypothetical protein